MLGLSPPALCRLSNVCTSPHKLVCLEDLAGTRLVMNSLLVSFGTPFAPSVLIYCRIWYVAARH